MREGYSAFLLFFRSLAIEGGVVGVTFVVDVSVVEVRSTRRTKQRTKARARGACGGRRRACEVHEQPRRERKPSRSDTGRCRRRETRDLKGFSPTEDVRSSREWNAAPAPCEGCQRVVDGGGGFGSGSLGPNRDRCGEQTRKGVPDLPLEPRRRWETEDGALQG